MTNLRFVCPHCSEPMHLAYQHGDPLQRVVICPECDEASVAQPGLMHAYFAPDDVPGIDLSASKKIQALGQAVRFEGVYSASGKLVTVDAIPGWPHLEDDDG